MQLIVNIDGGSRGNPGPAGAGVVIKTADDGTIIQQAGVFLGTATNNVAEYTGLVEGLKRALVFKPDAVHIISDSELLVKQIKGIYRVKNAGLKPLYQQALELIAKFDKFSIEHVKRAFNKEADEMANRAMNTKQNFED